MQVRFGAIVLTQNNGKAHTFQTVKKTLATRESKLTDLRNRYARAGEPQVAFSIATTDQPPQLVIWHTSGGEEVLLATRALKLLKRHGGPETFTVTSSNDRLIGETLNGCPVGPFSKADTELVNRIREFFPVIR
ncbi:MAG: hypothetical protein IPK79_12410 [Vampirovibrionales bacterium]|nr:hypothetical protein [Vampirovibrionales bacterium]